MLLGRHGCWGVCGMVAGLLWGSQYTGDTGKITLPVYRPGFLYREPTSYVPGTAIGQSRQASTAAALAMLQPKPPKAAHCKGPEKAGGTQRSTNYSAFSINICPKTQVFACLIIQFELRLHAGVTNSVTGQHNPA